MMVSSPLLPAQQVLKTGGIDSRVEGQSDYSQCEEWYGVTDCFAAPAMTKERTMTGGAPALLDGCGKIHILGVGSKRSNLYLDASAIVLAGGKSLRFGKDKSRVKIGKRSLLEQVVACVRSVCGDVILVAGEQRIPQIKGYPELKVASDIEPGKGPLGGIYTGLKTSTTRLNLVVAGDMPFLNRNLLRQMLSLADSYDLVVPRVGDLIEPLHAVYTKSCLEPIEDMLARNELRVRALFPLVRVRYVEATEIEEFDPHHLSFFNVNTRADLAKAEAIANGDLTRDKC